LGYSRISRPQWVLYASFSYQRWPSFSEPLLYSRRVERLIVQGLKSLLPFSYQGRRGLPRRARLVALLLFTEPRVSSGLRHGEAGAGSGKATGQGEF
jgi:hypothetical protein